MALKGTEDRLYMVRGVFNKYPKGLKDSISAASNVADDRWRMDQYRVDLLVMLHFDDDLNVVNAWRRTRRETDNYGTCVGNLYLALLAQGIAAAPHEACEAHQVIALARFDSLRAQFVRHLRSHDPRPNGR